MRIGILDPEYLPDMWKDVEPLIDKVIPFMHGRANKADIVKNIAGGHEQLWVIDDDEKVIAIGVTSIEHRSQMSILNVSYIGGSRIDEWVEELFDLFCQFGVEKGCSIVECCGRKGWSKIAERYPASGFGLEYVIVSKVLNDVKV